MRKPGIASVLTRGVGRRILGLFILAGILPVIFTGYLGYNEVHRALENEANNTLRTNAQGYGVEILARLERICDKAEEIVRVINRYGIDTIGRHEYLLDDFESIAMVTGNGARRSLHGTHRSSIALSTLDLKHLAAGKSQLVHTTGTAGTGLALILAADLTRPLESAIAFRLQADKIWGTQNDTPHLTDYCVFSAHGDRLFCTSEMPGDLHATLASTDDSRSSAPATWQVDGERHFAAMWQLSLDTPFRHHAFDIVASQPQVYALRSGADFRRVFLPALVLVIILVAVLSFNFIGQSLVPLRRLTIAARQYAGGHLSSRVRIRTGDEFERLADAFNNMAARLGRQIATLKAMSETDKLILSGAGFEEVSEHVIDHLIRLTGCEAAAVIARDADSANRAKMISGFCGEYIHERIGLPMELGHQWCQPRQVSLREVDPSVAPYKARLQSYGREFAVIIPIVLNDDLKGILILGSVSKFDMNQQRLKRCVDLAGRVAVALASVERDEALYRQAHFDPLTGLPNRQLLKDRLEQQIVHARRKQNSGAMLFLDLDRFKEINDVHGHSVGDVVLMQAAERIVAEVRDTDTVARLGGDEFVIVMPHTHGENTVRAMASRLLARLSEAFSVRGVNHFVSASIGIVMFPDDGESVETLLKNADSAMYRAKDAGRSRFEFFSRRLNAESQRKIDLERDLRDAFQDRELEVYYQPQFDIDSGVISGAEALLRWRHKEQGFIPPREFIPLAEDSALVVEIGRWVIQRTCRDLRRILNKGLHPGPVSINVSARQLREAGFASDVLEPLHRFDIHPGYLQLEVTETTVAQNRDTAIDTLNTLRAEGVRVAIDDFGTGYSSLSYLQQMPFDIIKIDKSFVDLIGSGDASENICRTIITMAHELGKEAIAEGVETRAQLDFLSEHGCDFVQGFFYSKPLPNLEFVEFIEKQDFHTQRRKALEIA